MIDQIESTKQKAENIKINNKLCLNRQTIKQNQ